MGTKIDLSGEWGFRLDEEKKGIEEHFEKDDLWDVITLPGSTAYAKKGEPNRARETYFLTEVYKFEGYAWYKKTVRFPFKKKSDLKGKHFYLTLERTRISTVWVDGKEVGTQNSFIAKHVYDLTGYIDSLNPEITVMVSNVDYPAPGGHMTSPDTQTNWNGILGEISLEICEEARIEYANVTCDHAGRKAIINAGIEGFVKGKYKISVSGDLCILKKKYLEADADIDDWEERAVSQQAMPTDEKILEGYLDIEKGALRKTTRSADLVKGKNQITLEVKLPDDVKEWDEEEPYVYRLLLSVTDEDKNTVSERTLWFGFREFRAEEDHFSINGRKTFLRGRHQGMLFPLSGFAPMNVTGWLKDFKIAKDWGINHERCHTCTPPEAAFIAADLLGIYFEPEIPFWGTWHASDEKKYSEVKEAQEFLREEGFNILREYAGHPSFVMMSMGNELWGSPQSINDLIGGYKEVRPDILYTQGSNNFQWTPCVLPNDDFFVGVRFSTQRQLRGSYAQCDAPLGPIQKYKPATDWNYDRAIRPEKRKTASAPTGGGTKEIQYGTGVVKVSLAESAGEIIPHIPVVSHEIGQYFIYPDYEEIVDYTGVCQPRNLQVFQERLEDMGLSGRETGYFKASGALAIQCYKNELEAAFRSRFMAGFQMLDLQDYSGQGTALVGPLNALMQNKGLVAPEVWRQFCSGAVVMAEFADYVLTNGMTFKFNVKFAYYEKRNIDKIKLIVRLEETETGEVALEEEKSIKLSTASGKKEEDFDPGRGLFDLGSFEAAIPDISDMQKFELSLEVRYGKERITENYYYLWSYEEAEKVRSKTDLYVADEDAEREVSFEVTESGNVAITTDMIETDAAVESGKTVLFYLSPSENRSLPGAYCTDFWNYPMFKGISESMGKPIPVGTLGLLIDNEHPALAKFKCEKYTTPQWYEIVERSRTSLLNWLGFRPIVTVIDNCEANDNLGLIYEMIITDGPKGPCHVLVCTSPLRKLAKEGNAPAAALEKSLLEYLEGEPVEGILKTHINQLRRLTY